MKRIFVAALLAGTAISSAQAADLAARPYTKAPRLVAQVYDWTGFYFGVNAGVGLGRDRITHGFAGAFNDSVYAQPQGVVGGGQIGYNWQNNSSFLGLGPLVYGIEADIQGADMRDNRNALFGGLTTNYNQRLDWFGTVRGRVGVTNGPVLSYVTGGFAYGNVKTDVIQTGLATGTTSVENNMRSGYVLGSGVEAALGGNWTGKIEYLYLNMGNKNFAFTNAGIAQNLNSEIRENIFRVGLNYRINGNNSGYVPVAAANWTGFYLGGNVGSGIGRDRSSLNANNIVTDTFNLAPDGINGGVQAGYNWQAGNIVFGVEADIQASSQRDNKTCVLTCTAIIGAAYDARLPWFGTARGRIGYSVGSTLFYATGGYAYGNVKTDITTTVAGTATQTTSLRSTKDGYAVGGGIETPFTLFGLFGPNWTSKTEYLYVDLGRQTDTFAANGGTFTNSTKVQEHIFRTGINYHFNSPVVARY